MLIPLPSRSAAIDDVCLWHLPDANTQTSGRRIHRSSTTRGTFRAVLGGCFRADVRRGEGRRKDIHQTKARRLRPGTRERDRGRRRRARPVHRAEHALCVPVPRADSCLSWPLPVRSRNKLLRAQTHANRRGVHGECVIPWADHQGRKGPAPDGGGCTAHGLARMHVRVLGPATLRNSPSSLRPLSPIQCRSRYPAGCQTLTYGSPDTIRRTMCY